MKTRRMILALALALAMLLSMGTVAQGEGDLEGTIVVIHTNDVHGAIDGYAKVAAMKQVYEGQGAYVLLMDAGGYLQGHSYVSASQGEAAIELMNAAGYDLAAVGSYEFAYGFARLEALKKKAEFPMVTANVQYNGSDAFAASHVFTAADGTKIGVFGMTTAETVDKISADKLSGVTFLSDEEMVSCAKEQIERLQKKNCDIIICLSHLGVTSSDSLNSIALLQQVEGIDYLIDGHSHATLEEIKALTGGTGKVGNAAITSAGTGFEEIGVLLIKGEEFISMNLAADSIVVSDDQVAAKAEAIKAAAETEEERPDVEESTPVPEPEKEPGSVPSVTYTDVSADAWYAEAVNFVTEKGLMNGADGAFSPAGTLNRAMMVTVLYRMAGSPAVEETAAFTDVDSGAWYSSAVAWAVEQGITNGATATTFNPNGAITREQLATFLYRYAGTPAVETTLSGYKDVTEVGDYAISAMAWANANGYVTGTAADTLSPKNTANRATVATVLMRYLK